MATPIATAAVQIVPSFKGLHQSTAKAIGGVESQFKKSGGQSGSVFSKALKGVAGAGVVAAGGAIATGFGMAIAKGFSRLNAIDQAEKKLQGLGHSTQAVEGIMKNALASVKGTAFGLDEAANVAASLVASGIKPGQELEKTLKTVADSATIAGIGMEDMGAIFGKVAATGKLQGDELNQLSERGIPALQLLSKHLGVTTDEVRKMVSKGQVDFKTFAEAMESGMGGAAQKSGETFMGAWKNVQAALGRIGATLLEPVFNALKDAMNVLTPALDEMQKAMEPFAATLAELISDIMPVATAVFKGLVAVLVNLVTWLSKNMWLVKTLAGLVAFAAAAYAGWVIGAKLLVAVQTVQMLIGYKMLTLTKLQALATGLWAKAQAGLNAMLSANPIGAVIVAIIALIAIFVVAYKKVGWFRNAVNAAWAGIKFAVGAVVTWFQTFVWPALQRVWAWIAQGVTWLWQNVMIPAWNGIKATVFAVVGWFQTTMLPFIQATFKAVGAVFHWLWAWVVRPIFGFIKAYIQVWWASVKVVFNALVWFFRNVLGPVFKWLWTVISAVLSLAKAMFIQWVNSAKATFSILVRFVKSVLGPVFQWLWNWIVKPVFNFMKAHIQVWWLAVRLVFQALVNFIRRVIGPAFLWLWRNVVIPAWNGIKAVISGVWNFIRDRVFNPLAHAVKHTLPAAFRAGRDAIGRAWDGLKNIAKKPVEFVVNTVINKGLVDNFNKIARFFKSKEIPAVSLPRGFDTGGWTGPGSRLQPAGIVHADEFVIKKSSRRRLEAMHPGLLDHMNRYGAMPGYARGGSVGTLSDSARWWQSKGARISEFGAWGQRVGRHSRNSLHYSGRAYDVNYGPGGENAIEKAFFNKHVGEFKRLFPGVRVIWAAPGHHNHLHADNSGGADIGSGGSAAGGFDILGYLKPFQKVRDSIMSKIGESQFAQVIGASAKKLMELPIDWIKKKASFVADVGEKIVDNVAAAGVKAQVRAVASTFGWGFGPQWDAIDWIVNRESSWNPRAANPTSSARGLFQKMTSIHGAVESTPAGQAMWGLKYIKSRYGSPTGAMSAWRRKGWYADGGRVTPTLYDTGGWLPPGLTLTQNATGKPEAVFTNEQFQHIKEAALHESPISITINGVRTDNAEEVARAVRFELVRQGRGGRYATA
ncbi:tape measure protein [Brevibacterium paucivorans]|uniref:aggregation-promoting factor C-terminal-like domain-containing protein n=1 Tax=Brevibacterium paucivorans TaxID=170994 RepID=UPI00321C23D2